MVENLVCCSTSSRRTSVSSIDGRPDDGAATVEALKIFFCHSLNNRRTHRSFLLLLFSNSIFPKIDRKWLQVFHYSEIQ